MSGTCASAVWQLLNVYGFWFYKFAWLQKFILLGNKFLFSTIFITWRNITRVFSRLRDFWKNKQTTFIRSWHDILPLKFLAWPRRVWYLEMICSFDVSVKVVFVGDICLRPQVFRPTGEQQLALSLCQGRYVMIRNRWHLLRQSYEGPLKSVTLYNLEKKVTMVKVSFWKMKTQQPLLKLCEKESEDWYTCATI